MTFVQKKPTNPFDIEAREYLGTRESEAAVRRGLEFLAKRQSEDGHWESGRYRADAAITAFCTLGFLATGHQPGRGKYGDVQRKAVDWLVETVQRNGLVYSTTGSAGPPMYDHGFATLALAELYGMTHRADLRPRLESAVRLLVASQNPEGGWRYQPTSTDADMSVTTAQVVAMRAAASAGVPVNPGTVRKAVGYIKTLANEDGGFRYQANRPPSGPARTAAAVTSLMLAGERKARETLGGVRWLVEHPIDTNEGAYKEWYHYCLYYVTQAMYQVGGDLWKNWFTLVRERLLKEQKPDGSWYDTPGAEYATATAVLILQVPAGLLPIYQK